MRTVAEISVDPDTTTIHEQGWQSWSPSTAYRLDEQPHRPIHATHHTVCYRKESTPPPDVYNGEGLLAVDPGEGGPITVIAAANPTTEVPTIRASYVDGRVVVSANGDVVVRIDDGPGGAQGAYARWADQVVKDLSLPTPKPAPTTWCSWYQYFTKVTESDVHLNIDLMKELDLPIDVVQVDDGYEEEIGDWLIPSGRFADLPGLFKRITDQGRRAGIWTAPFLVGARSKTFAEHPDWLVKNDDGTPTSAGHNWNQDLFALDTTHPEAIDYLRRVFTTFSDWGIDFHKIDFIYAAALPGNRHEDTTPIEAYRSGVNLIRSHIGNAHLLGCGAPQLPSIGLFDSMRIGADIAPKYQPDDGDLSQPSQRGAALNVVSRAFQHGRFWANDPDCIIARPEVERREEWAAHVARFGGLRSSSDGLDQLDDWGMETTRNLLSAKIPKHFIAS